MNVGSLFSGIGGIDLGLERAGMHVAWQVECDPYARAVLRKHWPHAALYDDVRSIGAANLAPVDLICGGFPCQDISNAGKRAGIEGERSGLWSEYARIVRELRPSYVLVENVAALLARGLERVVGDLAACGYDAEWDCFPAAAFGAPHRRDRLFIVAHANKQYGDNGGPRTGSVRRNGSAQANISAGQGSLADADSGRLEERGERDSESQARESAPFGRDAGRCGAPPLANTARNGREQGRQTARSGLGFAGDCGDPLADAHLARLEGRHGDKLRERGGERPPREGGASRDVPDAACVERTVLPFGVAPQSSDAWIAEPDVGRVAHGVPSRVDRLRCLGNAVVPQVAEWIGRQILAHAEGA